jgi:D-alanyl-lipoteichoic acid acyltransferase DltB (MBOAT superfamily)
VFFDSPVYFLFLALTVGAYWCLRWRSQNVFLVLASYFFYGWWDWRFLGLMFTSTLVDYWVAQRIEATTAPRPRKLLLALSLTVNFGFLGFFKYFDFFVASLAGTLQQLGVAHPPEIYLHVLLPPAISFYTFQEVAYIVDVYRSEQKAARSFVDYSLFVSFFPHLVAGPIQRPAHLLGQVQAPRRFDHKRATDGLLLIATGLFRKCVIADNFAVLANAAFAGKLGHSTLATLIGAFAFAFQIYGDFCGYSDLARGSAQLFGFHFSVNFRRPYLAASLQDFWRRWHISLSSWLRDYLYIGLGGSRRGTLRTYANLLATMLLGGLWHGANWTYLVWGGFHGAWLGAERAATGWLRPRLAGARGATRLLDALVRTCALGVVLVAWVFFRAENVGTAGRMLADLAHFEWRPAFAVVLAAMLPLAAVVIAIDLLLERHDEECLFQNTPVWGTVAAVALLALTVLFGATDSSAFIYFQF